MSTPARLVIDARTAAGLSMRALAARAGVAYTTVSRIEHGQIDPTFRTLERLLAAAGQRLEVGSREADGPELAALVDAWRTDATGQDQPDWTRLRGFLDSLALRPEFTGAATLRMPAPSGSAFMDSLLAGMAEKICDDAGLPRPTWARRVPPLTQPWASPGTPRMQELAARFTPEQFRRRGITMRSDSLWRDLATVGLT